MNAAPHRKGAVDFQNTNPFTLRSALFPGAVHIREAASSVFIGTCAVHIGDTAGSVFRLQTVHVVEAAGCIVVCGHPIQVCNA
jgi:hypothetical protein